MQPNYFLLNKINASIITIGDELLIGQTIDTNSAFIAQELNKIGVWVHRRVAVGDNWDDIWNTLDEEGKFIYANKWLLDYLGYTLENLNSREQLNNIHEDSSLCNYFFYNGILQSSN